MLTMVGASGQISLGKMFAGQYFDMELQEDGSILLKPMTVIPEEEAWLHTPEMQAQLERGDTWMKEHPPAETDLDVLAKRLGVKW
ncbi:MAG: hypothetical protein WAV07_00180 [Candidatus Contendobacter sp.]